jgi:NAD(P) transhydrogenase subunit beta
MNRSITNVLFGAFGKAPEATTGEAVTGTTQSMTAAEAGEVIANAERVVIVPGYGMAVSQAQLVVKEFYDALTERGIDVKFAVHPVAGRMPGHMNVLLAEAGVPYDKLYDMDQINPDFRQSDVAIVIGANDVVNPAARTDPQSPIAGMPILDVDKARTVVMVKRSLSPGFAGIPNPLFAADNTLMLFADGKDAVLDIVKAVKES